MNFSKFFPRLQKFLMKNPCYTAEKKSIKLNFLRRTHIKYYKIYKVYFFFNENKNSFIISEF